MFRFSFPSSWISLRCKKNKLKFHCLPCEHLVPNTIRFCYNPEVIIKLSLWFNLSLYFIIYIDSKIKKSSRSLLKFNSTIKFMIEHFNGKFSGLLSSSKNLNLHFRRQNGFWQSSGSPLTKIMKIKRVTSFDTSLSRFFRLRCWYYLEKCNSYSVTRRRKSSEKLNIDVVRSSTCLFLWLALKIFLFLLCNWHFAVFISSRTFHELNRDPLVYAGQCWMSLSVFSYLLRALFLIGSLFASVCWCKRKVHSQ